MNAGHTVYTKFVLSIYDWWVLGFSNACLWKCPTTLLESEFKKNATPNHLDVGVGTGYFPHKCLPDKTRRLALLDLNQNSLERTASRVSRFKPELYQADVLDPLSLPCDMFDSISLFYLIHCLPGAFEKKSQIFNELKKYLRPGGMLFGSTILGKDVPDIGFFAKKLMAVYNEKGIFCNYDDSLDALSAALNENFASVDIRMVGCVAIFSCV